MLESLGRQGKQGRGEMPSVGSYRQDMGEKPPLAEGGQPIRRLSKARASTLTCIRGNYAVRRVTANGVILQLESQARRASL